MLITCLQSVAGVEETASFISRYTFSYISRTLFTAYKVPRISVEELPPISDKRNAENMSRKFKVYTLSGLRIDITYIDFLVVS